METTGRMVSFNAISHCLLLLSTLVLCFNINTSGKLESKILQISQREIIKW